MATTCAGVAVLCTPVLQGLTDSAHTSPARFVPYSAPFAYGLRSLSPWKDGGKLVVKFPEHLRTVPGCQVGVGCSLLGKRVPWVVHGRRTVWVGAGWARQVEMGHL